MLVSEVINIIDARLLAGSSGLQNEVKDVYIGDLLSWVMGNGTADCAWVTVMGHINIIAVAELIGCACIILAEGAPLNADTLEKADEEGIPILISDKTSYEIAKKLANL